MQTMFLYTADCLLCPTDAFFYKYLVLENT